MEDAERAGNGLVTIALDDLDAHETRLRAVGVAFTEQSDRPAPRCLVVEDVDGNTLKFFQDPARSGGQPRVRQRPFARFPELLCQGLTVLRMHAERGLDAPAVPPPSKARRTSGSRRDQRGGPVRHAHAGSMPAIDAGCESRIAGCSRRFDTSDRLSAEFVRHRSRRLRVSAR